MYSMSIISYQREYGTNLCRVDSFGGAPRWAERVIREYELGPHGPTHDCTFICGCDSCSKLRWFSNPVCTCKIGNIRGKFLTLHDAMRQKWLACRCEPSLPPWTDLICPCLLLLPTQEVSIVSLSNTDTQSQETTTDTEENLETEWIVDL